MHNLENLSLSPSCVIFDASKSTQASIQKYEPIAKFNKIFYRKNISNYENVKPYYGSDEITHGCGELTILCGRSLLNGIAKYPYRSKYVLFHISLLNPFFYLGFVGLIRRYILGLKDPNAKVTFKKIYNIGRLLPTLFVLIQNPNAKVTNHYSVNSDIGYKGFLDFLNATNRKYAVLRFFEKLPHGNRVGGDLDILVEDELEDQAIDFLTKNPGTEMVDMYSVSGPSNASRIPYHTPFLSRKILEEAVRFNGYLVPNDLDYFHSFIYHCLYHKGLSSGIKSIYPELNISKSPDNDYMLKIKELGDKVEIKVGDTLEDLDSYMGSVGWRPHTDTLDLLSSSNKWLLRHLKSQKLEDEITLTICVLKNGFHKHHKIENFKNSLKKQGLEIIKYESLDNDRKLLAYNHLRGGNWSATNEIQYSPSDIFILFDKSNDGIISRRYKVKYDPRSKKEFLRSKYDIEYQSHIHMTDNTHQASEYVNVMYPGELDKIKNVIKQYDNDFKDPSNLAYINILIYKIKNLPRDFKEFIFESLRGRL